jgi:outer membrane receptor protein involved in Fe transport
VKLEGAILAEELLNQLPQVAPSEGAFISNGAGGIATVDLRNLGASRTLVLVNGRRMGPGDPRNPLPDINMIPTSLIQRVEVLTGGASSVYGSDAVSGVVNFILDTKLEGLRVDGQASVFQHDNRNGSGLAEALERAGIAYPTGNTVDGGRQNIDVAFGHGFFDDRAHVTLYAGYRRLDAVAQASRDYSACPAEATEQDATILECGGSFTGFPANFITNFADSNSIPGILTLGPDRTFVPGFNIFNFAPWNYYQRPDRRWTAGGFADAEISSALRPYVEVMYLDDRSLSQIAPSANFGNTGTINCDNPLLSDQQKSLVCFTGNFIGEFPIIDDDGNVLGIEGSPIPFTDPVTGDTYFRGRLIVLRRGVDTGPRQEDLRHKTLRLLGGVKGDVGRGVSYDISYLRNRAKMNTVHLNDYLVSRLRRALDVISDPATGQPVCRSVLTGEDPACVPWDIFRLEGVSPEASAYVNFTSFRKGTVTEQVANANMTVDFGEWGVRSPWSDEAPAINLGAEFRKDELDYEPDPHGADIAGSPEDFPVHGSTEVKELFAEARIPLLTDRIIERLAFEGGYRQSWYSNPSSEISSNAYKLALDLTAVRGLRFRATQQRAVRAPNIVELFFPPISDFFEFDRCAGPTPQATQAECALTGVSASQYGHILRSPGTFGYNAISGGNPDLEPETATTRTAGVVLEPAFLRGFNATIDWWSIDLKGAIEEVRPQTIMNTCLATGDPFFCNRIHRDANGSLWLTPEGFVDSRLVNIGSIKIRGIDVGATYTRGLGSHGSVTAEFLGSYLDRFTVDNGGLSTPVDCAGKIGVVCVHPTPRWRHKARLTWDTPSGISLSFHWRYTGKMSTIPLPDFPPPGPLTKHVRATSFFDLSALFRVQRKLVLRFGVNNIFDREPPLVPLGPGASPSPGWNGNIYPQWYDPLGRYIFAGFTVNF